MREEVDEMKKMFPVVLVLMLLLISGCGREAKKLRNENEALKAKVNDLEKEIAKLKETAEFHYQNGLNFLKLNKHRDAKKEFETVVEKYPTSPLINSANQQLETVNQEIKKLEAIKLAEEKRRQEEQQYRPKDNKEANNEWEMFRREPDKYKGTITTWSLKVSRMAGALVRVLDGMGYISYVSAILEGPKGTYHSHYVEVFAPEGYTPGEPIKNQKSLFGYQELLAMGKVPKVVENDWIVVTGKFVDVSTDGEIILKAIRIKNEGYRGE
jgi:uncharacterized lipoprotein YehR (DUF1307 family)